MKILVYVEPSVRGEWALSPALDLARGLGGTVLLLTTEEDLKDHPALLDQAAAKFSGTSGLMIEKKVRPGPPRQAILLESKASSPAITVFPPAGRRGLARMIHGSRVKAVVHNAPSTVMVAKKPVSEHIHRILVTVSGGPFSETTVLSAQEIAGALGAELTVLHVASAVVIPYVEVKGHFAEVEPGARETPSPAETPGRDLRELLSRLGLLARLRCREGMVVHEILEECHEGHHDLLVLGQHLADTETGPLSANIAEILALECPIPVLVVRPRRWPTGAAAAAAAGEKP